jgi:hypothetical protein
VAPACEVAWWVYMAGHPVGSYVSWQVGGTRMLGRAGLSRMTTCMGPTCQVAWWVLHGRSVRWVLAVMAGWWDPHVWDG